MYFWASVKETYRQIMAIFWEINVSPVWPGTQRGDCEMKCPAHQEAIWCLTALTTENTETNFLWWSNVSFVSWGWNGFSLWDIDLHHNSITFPGFDISTIFIHKNIRIVALLTQETNHILQNYKTKNGFIKLWSVDHYECWTMSNIRYYLYK